VILAVSFIALAFVAAVILCGVLWVRAFMTAATGARYGPTPAELQAEADAERDMGPIPVRMRRELMGENKPLSLLRGDERHTEPVD
jgi:hypothetical protein